MLKAEVCRECKRARFETGAYSWSEWAPVDFEKTTQPVQTREVTCTQCLIAKQHEIASTAGVTT